MITRWCSSYRFRSPFRISIVSWTVGGSTITVWKRRSSAPSFSMYLRYSFRVDAPTHCSSPRASAGLSMLDASTAPSAAPAPTSVCSSSMNRMMLRFCAISLMTALSRSSNWPRYLVPAITAAMSSASTRWSLSASGHWPVAISCASPSTMAVFPTPGSPISTGLFFLRRERISITRSISFCRPIVGSSDPSAASWVRSRQKWSRAGVLDFFSLLGAAGWVAAPPAGAVDGISLPSSRSVSARACSRFTPASVSTCAAMPFSSRSSPNSRCSVPTYEWFSSRASLIASSSTFFAREVYGRSGPAAAAAFPFFTVSSIFCWISSRSTFRLVSTAAATPSPSRIRPSRMCSVPTYSWCSRAASSRAICRTLRTRSVKLYPFISPPTSSSRRLGLQHATHIRRAHRRQLGITALASLECRQVRGLGEYQQLVQCVYTQARDQIQPDAQPHPAQKIHRLFERQLPRVLQEPVCPPGLVGHLVGGRPQQHVPRLLFVLDHLSDDLAKMIEQFVFRLAQRRLVR